MTVRLLRACVACESHTSTKKRRRRFVPFFCPREDLNMEESRESSHGVMGLAWLPKLLPKLDASAQEANNRLELIGVLVGLV